MDRHVRSTTGEITRRRSTNAMSDSGHTLETCKIEPRETFRVEEAVNLDDCAARNRKANRHDGPLVGHDDHPAAPLTSAGVLIAAGCADVIAVRASSGAPRRTNDRAGCRSQPSTRSTTSGSSTATGASKAPRYAAATNASDYLSLTSEVGVWRRGGCTVHASPRTAGELSRCGR